MRSEPVASARSRTGSAPSSWKGKPARHDARRGVIVYVNAVHQVTGVCQDEAEAQSHVPGCADYRNLVRTDHSPLIPPPPG